MFIKSINIREFSRLKGIINLYLAQLNKPAMILVLTRRIIAYRERSFFIQDYSAAIENILIAAVVMGYESCWVEGHITDTDNIGRQMADVLGVPEEYELVCYLPIGKAIEPTQKPVKQPFSARAWFNDFGKQE